VRLLAQLLRELEVHVLARAGTLHSLYREQH
jgi:hypothetical protein